MAEPQTLATAFPTEVWTALGGGVTLIIGLVSLLWDRQNSDIKDHAAKLDSGQKAFSGIGEQFVKIGEQLKALEKEDAYECEELDRLELDLKDLTSRLLVLETEHKSCTARNKKSTGD